MPGPATTRISRWSIVVMAEQAGKTPAVGQLVAQLVVAGSTVSSRRTATS